MDGDWGWVFWAVVSVGACLWWFRREARAAKKQPAEPVKAVEEPTALLNAPPKAKPTLKDEIDRVRKAVRDEFQESEKRLNDEVGFEQRKRLLADAAAYLRSADTELVLNGFINQARPWGIWQAQGHSDSVPAGVITRDTYERSDADGGRSEGYIVEFEGHVWGVEWCRLPSYGDGGSLGRFSISRDGECVFRCSMFLEHGPHDSNWRVSLSQMEALRTVDWLPDLAAMNELGKARLQAVLNRHERERVLARSSAVNPDVLKSETD